jgi:histidine ammonia-lyase
MNDAVLLDGASLTLEQLVRVARQRTRVAVAESARRRVDRCRAMVELLLDRGQKVYGLTTGFGKLRDVMALMRRLRRRTDES